MPSQWIRWRPDTHIYEYSVDFGTTWGPLPLNASVINEGVIDPARLPDMGGGVDPAANITWTGTHVWSFTSPRLTFNETDQAVGLKNWNLLFDGSLFKICSLSDAYAVTAELLTLSRGGVLTLNATAAAAHTFSGNVNGAILLDLINTNTGTVAYGAIRFQNNSGASRAHILVGSSTLAITGYIADALNLQCTGVGGVAINASAGSVLLRTANVTRMTISNAGAITFQGTVSFADLTLTGDLTVNDIIASGTIRERNRTILLGGSNAVTYASTYFTATSGTWTVAAADMQSFGYSIVGNMMTVWFDLVNSTTTAATTELRVTIPGGFVATANVMTVGHAVDAGIPYNSYIFAGNGLNYLSCRTYSTTAYRNWAAQTDTLQLRAVITFPI